LIENDPPNNSLPSTRSRKQQIVMNSDENDSSQITEEEEANNVEKSKIDTTVQERSEYDFDDSNPEDSNGLNDKSTSEPEVEETGQKRTRGRNAKIPTRARDSEGSPPRKSARIANK